MQEIIRKDILSVLDKAITILSVREDKNISELKELSNHTIHNASIFQDEYSVSIAVSIYALSKITERGGSVNQEIIKLLISARDCLARLSEQAYSENIKKLLDRISGIDSRLRLYIGEVIDQAQIKKGGKVYEHGISMARAAEILGISQWELMNYVGKTKIMENMSDRVDAKTRLGFSRKIFGLAK